VAADKALTVGGVEVRPGQRATIRVPVARRTTHAEVSLPVHVVCGKREGPRLFVSAALHGDEINGVEIIRRLLRMPRLRRLQGALIAVPIVNVYGFVSHSRYLPDRRDLNRSFPGSKQGSLTARLASQFMDEIVGNATHGIDLHTGSLHRANLPHVRACLDDHETLRLARAFGTPVIMNANVRDGSLRQAVFERQIPMLLYEGGEALRFDELAIRVGLKGIVAVMRAIGMLKRDDDDRRPDPFVARSSSWVRAPDSGILRSGIRLGATVEQDEQLGVISDVLGDEEIKVVSSTSGVVIGRTELPLVNEGDALFHIARFDEPSSVTAQLDAFHADLAPSDRAEVDGDIG
jgi:predicted deacylase